MCPRVENVSFEEEDQGQFVEEEQQFIVEEGKWFLPLNILF